MHRDGENYPRLDSFDMYWNTVPSNANNRVVNDKGNLVAGQFRFDASTPWLIVTV
jgi:hypothetical protein